MKKKLPVFGLILLVLFAVFALWLYGNYSVPIFMYHSFDKSRLGKYAVVLPETFTRQMNFISKRGYTVISLDEYCRLLRNKKKIAHNLVVITIDDGYRDNRAAIKILKEFDFPATIFLIVDKIGQKQYLLRADIDSFLNDTKITIGSHTLSHSYLPEVDDDDLVRQLGSSKKALEDMFDVDVAVITYPFGGFDERVLREVKTSGYNCACTTNRGFSRSLDILALRRIKITERDSNIRLWAKLSGFYNIFRRPKNPY